ncbi:MAG: helix-turn-helix domain-containing protein [Planctomycetota bacterium]
MKADQVDALFAALAHAGRRRMLDLVMGAPGMSVQALASHFDMSRIAVLKHVQLLERVDLLLSKKRGRTRHLYFNPVPIQLIHDRWTTQYSAFWSERMVDLKSRVETDAHEEQKRA